MPSFGSGDHLYSGELLVPAGKLVPNTQSRPGREMLIRAVAITPPLRIHGQPHVDVPNNNQRVSGPEHEAGMVEPETLSPR